MEVILLERVEKLGNMGDVVNVKSGFARNFLLPSGRALRSSKANLAKFEAERAALETVNAEKRGEAETQAKTIDGTKLVIIRQASESGNLFGSVTPRDIADAIDEAGHKVERRNVALDKPIKELGLHEISIRLHPEVSITVTANVARSNEEAELQAQGKSIAQLRAEEEAAEAAEFDVQSLFDEEADLSRLGDEEKSDDGESADADASEEAAADTAEE